MLIYITYNLVSKVPLNVDPSATIATVKKLLSTQLFISTENKTLTLSGNVLSDGKTLSDLGVKQDTVLTLEENPQSSHATYGFRHYSCLSNKVFFRKANVVKNGLDSRFVVI